MYAAADQYPLGLDVVFLLVISRLPLAGSKLNATLNGDWGRFAAARPAASATTGPAAQHGFQS
jgi:hypothetical protein